MPAHVGRRHQAEAISRGVRKVVNDRALRMMLPEPRGTFETVGEKVCQELVQLRLAHSDRVGYELTEVGREAISLLASRKYVELRRLMTAAHLQTYDNLRTVLQTHFEVGFIWRPIVESMRLGQEGYIEGLLEPTFGKDAVTEATALNGDITESPKRIENTLHARVLERVIPSPRIGVPLFRAMCDRLVSLRLLNIQRAKYRDYEFMKSYSPCVSGSPTRPWHMPTEIQLSSGSYVIYLCEPNMSDTSQRDVLLKELDQVLATLTLEGGYYDIPEVRDLVCERLKIPEASFDDGINRLLDMSPPVLSVGLRYERISGRRKPLVRNGQIHNLMRRV